MNPRGGGRQDAGAHPARAPLSDMCHPPRLIHLLSCSACQLLLPLQLLSQWRSPGGRSHSEAAPRGKVDHLGLFIRVFKG